MKMPSYQHRKSIVEIRWSYNSLILTVGFPIVVRCHLSLNQCPGLLTWINTLRPRQEAAIFQTTFSNDFLNENIYLSIEISFRFVPRSPVNNTPALVQIMAWPSHYLNQWWLVYWCIYPSLGLNELTLIPAWINNHMPSKVWDEVSKLQQLQCWSLGMGLVITSHTL